MRYSLCASLSKTVGAEISSLTLGGASQAGIWQSTASNVQNNSEEMVQFSSEDYTTGSKISHWDAGSPAAHFEFPGS